MSATASATASATFASAMNPTRNLTFFTLTAFAPLLVVSGVLLLGNKQWVSGISILAIVTSMVGFGRLMYEIVMDIAGYPDFKFPVWIVLYLIVYTISGYSMLYYTVGSSKGNFSESLFLSFQGYLGDSTCHEHPIVKWLFMSQHLLSTFIQAVIITKFVSAF